MSRKRRKEVEPHLWRLAPNIYLCPAPDRNFSDCYTKWKERFPNITIVFLKNWSTQNALMTLVTSNKWNERNGYYILQNNLSIPLHINWNGKKFTVTDEKVVHLGSEVCSPCFKEGRLYPITCPKHITCLHKKRDETCTGCVAKTFAGYWKEKVVALSSDTQAINILRCASSKFEFLCSQCGHYFMSSAHHVTNQNAWCPYCVNQKRCKSDCSICVKNSFASHEKSQFWHKTKNLVTPSMVSNGDSRKYWFKCDICFHDFETSPHVIVGINSWCPYCVNRKRCGVDCNMCFNNSFASHEKSQFWHHLKNKVIPRMVAKCDNRQYWFICEICSHSFQMSPGSIVNNQTWCPYCVNRKRCEMNCDICLNKSFASHPKSQFWHPTKNMVTPRMIARQDNDKYWFICGVCSHEFENSPSVIIGKNTWCPYCVNQKRCDKQCTMCFNNSFASHEKSHDWHPTKNTVNPRMIARKDNRKYWFICRVCHHDFEISPKMIIGQNQWCAYCANQKRCDQDECRFCFNNSFASHEKSRFWHCRKNTVSPRLVALNDHRHYWFTCEVCHHDFASAPTNIVCYIRWCPYCAHKKRCENGTCSTCALNCEICLIRKANFISQTSRRKCCKLCLEYIIKNDPLETPLQLRAKISLEIYTLAELQRTSHFLHFLSQEPTSWDCPVLPSLGFKPDIMWCWDNDGNCFLTTGVCKLNENEIAYTLILEVVEESRSTHSASRSIPDAERERQIRDLFIGKAIGFCYMTVAHTKHNYAHPDDVFFAKNEVEYYVPEPRLDAWQDRIDDVRDKLSEMHKTKSCETIYIGH